MVRFAHFNHKRFCFWHDSRFDKKKMVTGEIELLKKNEKENGSVNGDPLKRPYPQKKVE